MPEPVPCSKSSSRQTPAAGTFLDGDNGFESEGNWFLGSRYFDEEKDKHHLGLSEANMLGKAVSGLKEYFEKDVGLDSL